MEKEIQPIEGPILPSMIRFGIPLMLSGLLQVLYNAADLAVIGQFSGQNSVAAVGATGPVTGLVLNLFLGVAVGVNVVFARCLGAGEEQHIRDTVHSVIFSGVLLGVVAAGILAGVTAPLLRLTNCPESCFEGARRYLLMYAVGVPANLVYNFGNALLRTKGDTKHPFYYLVISGILNVVLNLLFVVVIPLDVFGVALATVISQYVSAVLIIAKLTRESGACRLDLRHLYLKHDIVLSVLRYGIPSGITSSLYALSNMQIQAAINSFGEAAIAGNSTAAQFENLVATVANAFSGAIVVFVGQNVGAGKPDRVKRSIWCGGLLTFLICAVGGLGCSLLGAPLLRLFIKDGEAAIQYGVLRMRFNLTFYFLIGLEKAFASTAQAYGRTFRIMLNSIVCIFGLRFLWMTFVFPLHPIIEYVFVCWPLTWVFNMVADGIVALGAYRKYRRELKTS